MKKTKFLLSKQGVLFRLISTFFQCLIILPVSALFSVILSAILVTFSDVKFIAATIVSFSVFNLFWIIYNSFIRVYEDRIVFRSWIGQRQTIELSHISELKIISSKELKAIIMQRTPVGPLITNAAVLMIPVGSFIAFKNSADRDVVIGCWNVNKLYDLLSKNVFIENEKISSDFAVIKNSNETDADERPESFICFVKMSIKGYILTFFTHFYKTILLPLSMTLILMWLINFVSDEMNKFIFVFPFLLLSAFEYYKILRIVVSPEKKIIKLNLFSENNKNVIKYSGLKKLDVNSKINVDDLNGVYDSVIYTPFCRKNKGQIISFETSNDNFIALSVNETQKLYKVLDSELNR